MHFPGKLKDLSKTELKVFDNLHRTIRNEADWLEFTKLFMLYIDGIISINDMFRLFEEKFGHRINEELMKDIE
jgi:histone deacetylase complex regulatory component SIN3